MRTLPTLSLVAAFAALAPAQNDIATVASKDGRFSTLVTALQRAGLVETLQGEGPFTVFAPTDEAFAKVPERALGDLLQRRNREKLQAVLTYHVVPGSLKAADVLKRRTLNTVNGQRVEVMMEGDDVRIGNAGLVKTDIVCSNGVIHVIDSVLMPETKDIVGVASAAGNFGTLLTAAKAAGLADALAGKGPFTVLAPTDAAFAKLGKDAIADLLKPQNKNKLATILKYHVIPARAFSDQALAAGSAATLQGDAVQFRLEAGRLQVNGTRVVANDIQAGNGVIHVIESVLLPPTPPVPDGRLVIGVYTGTPSQALAAQLGIDRDEGLVVDRLTADGNAKKDGLRQYDVIVGIDGMSATSANLAKAKANAGFGGVVQLEVIRAGKRTTVPVTVGIEKH